MKRSLLVILLIVLLALALCACGSSGETDAAFSLAPLHGSVHAAPAEALSERILPEGDAAPSSAPAQTYILNTHTHKFHYPDCSGAASMKESNKAIFTGTRDEAIAQGYSPCGNCKP